MFLGNLVLVHVLSKLFFSTGQEQVTRLLEEPDRIKEEQMSMAEIEKQMLALKQDASNHSVTIAKLMHEDFAIDVAAAWQR